MGVSLRGFGFNTTKAEEKRGTFNLEKVIVGDTTPCVIPKQVYKLINGPQ